MGMLATVINGLALMDRLEKMGAVVRVQSAIPMDKLLNLTSRDELSAILKEKEL